MKKTFYFAVALLAAFIFCSCTSIPKKVSRGDTLVIGKIRADASGYDKNSPYGNMNGSHTGNLEITIHDKINGTDITLRPNKDGFFYTTKLTRSGTYSISKVLIRVYGNGGYQTLWVNMPQTEIIIPYDNQIINTGCFTVYFNGSLNSANWVIKDHYLVKKYFDEMEFESEWKDKKMVNQCGDL